MTLVSQSEVDSFLGCQTKHYYGYGEPNADGSRGIAPLEVSEGLTRGNLGHEALEEFYKALQTGWGKEAGLSAGMAAILSYETDQTKLKTEVLSYFTQYVDYYDRDEEWEILAVEKEFRYQFPDSDIEMPFKPDLIVRYRSGKVFVVDHKFVGNFYQDRVFSLMPQLQKYCYALNKMGLHVDGYIYNQISTRKNAREQFRRVTFNLNDKLAQKFMDEQLLLSKEIAVVKETLDPEAWKMTAQLRRNASSFSCSHCPFLDICTADLLGTPGRQALKDNFYQKNSYANQYLEKEV